jgi:hypothetical protein
MYLRTDTSLVGSEGWMAERLAAAPAAGVTTVNASLASPDVDRQIRNIGTLKRLGSVLAAAR